MFALPQPAAFSNELLPACNNSNPASSRVFRGFGAALIKWAIEHARAKSCGLVQLTSDKKRPDAISFYQRLGFVVSHEGLKLRLGAT